MQEERARNAAAQTGVVNALANGLTKLSEGDLTIRPARRLYRVDAADP